MAFKIADISIGQGHKPFIIAEMSGNHQQSLDKALAIVDKAAESGAHALKLQTYTADTMTLNSADPSFVISDEGNLWLGRSLYDLYKEAYTPWEWHRPIMKRCADHGLLCFSTPFDETAVDFLEELKVPCYKIASFENTCTPLLKKVARTGKPIIMSTGMMSLGEMEKSVRILRENGCHDLVLLKCTSAYPAPVESSNLLTIANMRSIFDCEIGLSDHTLGIGVSIAAVALGASVIEKHFTVSRAEGGVDAAFSLEPPEFKLLMSESEKAWAAVGKVSYGSSDGDRKSVKFRRSVYVISDIKAGEILNEKNIGCFRPALGLHPHYWDNVLGAKASADLKAGTPLSLAHVASIKI